MIVFQLHDVYGVVLQFHAEYASFSMTLFGGGVVLKKKNGVNGVNVSMSPDVHYTESAKADLQP